MSKVEFTQKDGFHIIIIKGKSRFIPIVREEEELFSDTVIRAQSKANLTVCINASWYDLTALGKADAVAGYDPVPAKETSNQGIALLGTGKRHGKSSPLMFYIAQKTDYSWYVGQGDVPKQGFYTGIGGLCPLVINGLKYGIKNIYSKQLKDPILNGEPHPQHKSYLIQRSNDKYVGLHKADNRSGRGGLGFDKNGNLIIVVQQHGAGGQVSYDGFRDMFISFGCVSAVSVDGSDSVFLWYDKKFQFEAAEIKNETQTLGIGIRAETV